MPKLTEVPPGTRYGRGVVVSEFRYPVNASQAAQGRRIGARGFVLRCDCGNEYRAWIQNLQGGKIVSCGCYKQETSIRNATKHGYAGTSLYNRWAAIISRCYNPKSADFHLYGARGIGIAPEWRHDPGAFCRWLDANLGPCPAGWSIDRLDNDKGYEPGNLRWADAFTQARNQRRWSA